MKNQKGFVPVIIILVVLLGFVGFYYFKSLGSKEITQSSTPIPSAISMASWKVHKSDKYKFSFKYPEQLDKIEEVKYPRMFSIYQEKNTMLGDKSIKSIPWELSGSLSNTRSLEETLKNIQSAEESQFNFDIQSIKIDGSPAVRYKHCEMSCAEVVLLQHNGDFIGIQLYTIADIGIGEPKIVFDQILSTFKFTN